MEPAERLLERVDERTALLKQLVEDHVEGAQRVRDDLHRTAERVDALYRDDFAAIRRLCKEDCAHNEEAIQELREALARAEGALAMLKIIGALLAGVASIAIGLLAIWSP